MGLGLKNTTVFFKNTRWLRLQVPAGRGWEAEPGKAAEHETEEQFNPVNLYFLCPFVKMLDYF